MKKLITTSWIFVIALLIPMSALAVTPEEMDHAKAIAFKWYLRYANNYSDYLNKIEPKSMTDLNGQLKQKEKENIKTFEAIKIPKDYAKWDKNRTIQFWSEEALGTLDKDNQNVKEAKKAKNDITRDLGKIQMTEPGAAPKNADETEKKPEETSENTPEDNGTSTYTDPLSLTADSHDDASVTQVAPAQTANGAPNSATPAPKKESGTTVYVIILIVLVLIVAGIIVYALNNMKKGKTVALGGRKNRANDDDEDEDTIAQRRKYTKAIADKDKIITNLEQEIEDLKDEIETLRNQQRKQARRTDTSYRSRAISPQNPRTIYLAQANNKGVFVRADAKYNMGNSIFELVTTDGVSGTYKVIDDPEVFDLALTVPADYLMNACTGESLQIARGMHEIVNDTPGTAIFEEGKWRVLRKARIHYER